MGASCNVLETSWGILGRLGPSWEVLEGLWGDIGGRHEGSLEASWGKFKEDALPLTKVSEYRPLALKLIDEVKFDL